ncbi:MAG: hypothetical protein KIT54_01595 [Phycisphaeraceae bacterium]|nr:hypothetical protein [Phycisphaeraceae bacterium]
MGLLRDLPLALYELARMAIVARFRLRGAYYTWRWQTAFGRGTPPRGELLRGMIEFGAWAFRVRTGR